MVFSSSAKAKAPHLKIKQVCRLGTSLGEPNCAAELLTISHPRGVFILLIRSFREPDQHRQDERDDIVQVVWTPERGLLGDRAA